MCNVPIVSTGEPDRFAIHPLWGEFRNYGIEKDFLHRHLPQGQVQLRVALIICSVFYLAFVLTDVAVFGYTRDALILFLARLLVVVTAVAAIYLIRLRPFSIAIPPLAATTVEIVGMAAFMIIVVYRSDEMPWHGMSMSIMLIVVYLFIPNRLVFAAGVALVSTAIFIFIAIEIGNLKPSDTLTMSMLLVLANAFGGLANRRYHRLWRDEFRAQSILKQLSIRDHLTGCYNRRHLHEHLLEAEIARAQRHGLWLTVILCDIDHFKSVNDTYGHHIGDVVLRSFSSLLQKMTRVHGDCVIRYGGEEFLLVLPETDLAGGTRLAERLRAAFAENTTQHTAQHEFSTTASFGVAAIDFLAAQRMVTQYEMINAADDLLYSAKKAGRNHVKSGELQLGSGAKAA